MEILKTALLVTYFTILSVLSIYGVHRLWMLFLYFRHKAHPPLPEGGGDFLPAVTVQLAVFNEVNVVARLLRHVVRLDWPRDKLEIQVLDDSTDDTARLARTLLTYLELGFALYYFAAVLVAIYFQKWASVPFLWLFCSGFGYISLMSLTDVKVLRGLAMPELDDEKPAPLLLG